MTSHEFSNIEAESVEIGQGVIIDPTASIRGVNGKASRVTIGDNSYIGANVQIICDEFTLGDYGKIHHDTNIHGYRPCKIGHNAWIGQFCIIDSNGETTIGDNCGVGAHSQMWSHIKYGDRLEGNRFLQEKALNVGKDVWLVGHCIVSPIKAADKSMAMVGSVVTRDMAFNRVYAGVPAVDITNRVGPQFDEVSTADKMIRMQELLADFSAGGDAIRIVEHLSDARDDGRSYFAVATRQYLKTRSNVEVAFMRFLLPEKAKFTPVERTELFD